MKDIIAQCRHCKETIIECSWEEWTEFRNTKESFIDNHEIHCEENPVNRFEINEKPDINPASERSTK